MYCRNCPWIIPTADPRGLCHLNPQRTEVVNIDDWWCSFHPDRSRTSNKQKIESSVSDEEDTSKMIDDSSKPSRNLIKNK